MSKLSNDPQDLQLPSRSPPAYLPQEYHFQLPNFHLNFDEQSGFRVEWCLSVPIPMEQWLWTPDLDSPYDGQSFDNVFNGSTYDLEGEELPQVCTTTRFSSRQYNRFVAFPKSKESGRIQCTSNRYGYLNTANLAFLVPGRGRPRPFEKQLLFDEVWSTNENYMR
jgi:hypothetical protein